MYLLLSLLHAARWPCKHTAMRRAVLFCATLPAAATGQVHDSSSLGPSKTNSNLCGRIELGWNKSWFASAGMSYVYSSVNSHAPFFMVLYTGIEADVRNYGERTPFYAYKGGVEFGNLLLGMGAELRNSTNFAGKDHLIFMPKAGLTMIGHVSLYYGYNCFKTENNIFGIGRSQLSLSASLNRKVLKEALVPRHDPQR